MAVEPSKTHQAHGNAGSNESTSHTVLPHLLALLRMMITSQCNDFVCGAEGLESTKHILDGYLFLTRPFSVGGEF